MRLPIFLLLFGGGLIGTAVALRTATTTQRRQGVAFATGIGGGSVALWLIATIAAFNVVTVSNGVEITHSYPSLAVLGIVGIGVSMLVATKGSLELLRTQ
jgi:hypothetical protein